MKAAFTGPSAFLATSISMNMISHNGFAAKFGLEAGVLAPADFAVLLAVAAARPLHNRTTRSMIAQIDRTPDNAPDNVMDSQTPKRSHAQWVMDIVGMPAKFSKSEIPANPETQPYSHRFCEQMRDAAFKTPSFGNEVESPVYHGVLINVQTLGLKAQDQLVAIPAPIAEKTDNRF
jgi:hypothetical protein